MQSKEKAWDQMLLATEEVPNVKGSLSLWHKICYCRASLRFGAMCLLLEKFISLRLHLNKTR